MIRIENRRLAATALLIAASTLTACGGGDSEAEQPEDTAVLVGPENIVIVDSVAVSAGPTISGSLQPDQLSTIRAEIGGSVVETNADVGQRVSRGALLARIEDAAIQDAYLSARSAMTTAEQEDVLAKNVIERARQQIMLFRIILLMVSTVIIALIIFTMTMEKTRDIATLKIIGAPNLKIGALIMQESLSLGLLGYLFGALLINLTYDYFPRRVAILAFDQYILFGIVMVICVLASLVGIRRALAIDPTTAMGGGA